jgi:hypothetical protein
MVLRYSCILHYVPRYYLQDDIDTRAIQYCTIREHILLRDCKMTSHQLFVAGLVDTRAIQYCTIREHILIREHSLIWEHKSNPVLYNYYLHTYTFSYPPVPSLNAKEMPVTPHFSRCTYTNAKKKNTDTDSRNKCLDRRNKCPWRPAPLDTPECMYVYVCVCMCMNVCVYVYVCVCTP